jgi:AbrB family looped-hinge helix DNA binding protein
MVTSFEATIDKLGRIMIPAYFRKHEDVKSGDKIKVTIEKLEK